jgi:hypothetical protein
MPGDSSDVDELIQEDIEWLKTELQDLTKQQRRIILNLYLASVEEYHIGAKEYAAFVLAFDDLEE